MRSNWLLLFVVVLAVCLTGIASDIYAPSLPSIASNFNSDIGLVQWSMAIYMLGVAVSQLIYGPISEGIGRKAPLLGGLVVMLVGSFICVFASGVHALIWGRLIQGCGAGACASLWRAIFRDVFTGEELAKYGSYLVVFIMFIVPAIPLLGGYLEEFYGWRSSFVFMCVYTLITLFSILWGFKETSQHHHLERLKFSHIVESYSTLLKSPIFMGVTIASFLTYGAFFAWFVTGPVLLIKGMGVKPNEFGWITFLGGGTAYGVAGWLNGRVVKRFGMPNMLRLGWSIMLLASVLMLVGHFFRSLGIWVIVIPVTLFYFGTSFIWPNAFATAFTPFGKMAGYAAALYGFMQVSGAAALGGLMSHLPSETQRPLGLVMLGASICSWIVYESIVTRNQARSH